MLMYYILMAVLGIALGGIVTFFAIKSRYSGKVASLEMELKQTRETHEQMSALTQKNNENIIKQMRESHAAVLSQEKETAVATLRELKENYEKTLEDMKNAHEDILKATKNELALENEKMLKAREAALEEEAKKSIKTITDDLEKSIKIMKDSFEAQKEAQTKGTESIKTQLDETVKNLQRQTEKLGSKADNLSDALRGSNKIQGNWGEMKLDNIFSSEGLVKGQDYDKEDYLRDEKGNIIQNEETQKRMRPDFILHFPNNTDLIVDAKVNLDAYLDWFNAKDEETRRAASKRNLGAIEDQIKNLSNKSYIKYVLPGRQSLDYVIMFVSNYGAFQLAKQEKPNLFQEAFQKNVLITTEETIMPFLRMIRRSWNNYKQEKNQEALIKAATTMVERVAQFNEAYAKVGDNLKKAMEAYEKGDKKLKDGGQSIIKSAREVMNYGVKVDPKKEILLGGPIESNEES